MNTRAAILELRKGLNLSQEEFAEKIFVTRQAVSRWENGETVPSTDTLMEISKVFEVSLDYLMGNNVQQCQSCGMLLEKDSDRGTQADGSLSGEYCSFCFENGKFAQDATMEEMAEHNLQCLDEWNDAANLQITIQEAREQLLEFLPTLKRWKQSGKD